MTGVPWDLF